MLIVMLSYGSIMENNMRKNYYNLDKEIVDAVDRARDACRLGDVPDTTLGIISLLLMDGWEIVKRKERK